MKVGTITKTSPKGQIVIPKEFRDHLGIKINTPLNIIIRGAGFYIYPIKEVITREEGENFYWQILNKTKGTWDEDWDKINNKKRKLELKASHTRKKSW